MKLGGSVIGDILSGNLEKASQDFDKFKNGFAQFGNDIKNVVKSTADSTMAIVGNSNKAVDLMLKNKQEKLLAQADYEAKLEADQTKKNTPSTGKEAPTKKIKEATDKRDSKNNEAEKLAKEEIELANKVAEENIKTAKLELDNWILNNASKLADSKRLNQELIDIENKRLDELAQKKQQLNYDEYLNSKSKIENEVKDEILKKQQLDNLDLEYGNKKQEITNELEKARKDITLKYSQQTKEDKQFIEATEYQEKLQQLEVNNANEFEIKSFQLDRERELSLEKFLQETNDKFNLKLNTDVEQDTIYADIQIAKDELQAQADLSKDENEKLRLQAQITALEVMENDSAERKNK